MVRVLSMLRSGGVASFGYLIGFALTGPAPAASSSRPSTVTSGAITRR